jgi:hypothetical protein
MTRASDRFAFPSTGPVASTTGMTLRDYFAAKAMSALVTASGDSEGLVEYVEEIVAQSAYKMADAMLAEGAK